MLLRQTSAGPIGVTQPVHAWLSGELARLWTNGGFAVPAPRDTLVQAAALHDIGWLEWELAPQRDPASGLPLQFFDVPAERHTELWRRGVAQARIYGEHVALIVSRHGDAIYERTFDPATARPQAAEAVRLFRAEQARLQEEMIARLARVVEPELLSPAHLGRVTRFLVAVDTMSLQLCWGVRERITIADVPHADGATTLTLESAQDGAIILEPWLFARSTVALGIPARRLTHEGAGPPVTIEVVLRPAR